MLLLEEIVYDLREVEYQGMPFHTAENEHGQRGYVLDAEAYVPMCRADCGRMMYIRRDE